MYFSLQTSLVSATALFRPSQTHLTTYSRCAAGVRHILCPKTACVSFFVDITICDVPEVCDQS